MYHFQFGLLFLNLHTYLTVVGNISADIMYKVENDIVMKNLPIIAAVVLIAPEAVSGDIGRSYLLRSSKRENYKTLKDSQTPEQLPLRL